MLPALWELKSYVEMAEGAWTLPRGIRDCFRVEVTFEVGEERGKSDLWRTFWDAASAWAKA